MGKCGGDDVSSTQGPGLVVKEPQSGASSGPFQGTHKVKTVTLRWCLSFTTLTLMVQKQRWVPVLATLHKVT